MQLVSRELHDEKICNGKPRRSRQEIRCSRFEFLSAGESVKKFESLPIARSEDTRQPRIASFDESKLVIKSFVKWRILN